MASTTHSPRLIVVGLALAVALTSCRPPEPAGVSAREDARERTPEAEQDHHDHHHAVEEEERPARPETARLWTSRAPLPDARTEVSATSDGRYVYLAGGFGKPEGDLAMVALPEQAEAPRTVYRYDPEADEWEGITELPEGLNHTALAYHEGSLYVLGGFRENTFEPVGNVRIYDLEEDSWSEGAPMPTPRGAMAFTVHDGRIHLIGGNVEGPEAIEGQTGARIMEDRSVNVHEAYEPENDRWLRLAPMAMPRNHLGAASLEGRIHAVVGRVDGEFELTTHEIYDPETNSWTSGPPVPTGRSGVGVLAHAGHVYVFGGETFADPPRTFADAERYNPREERWDSLPPMPTARHGLGVAAVGDAIYTVSGGPRPAFAFGDATERLEAPPPVAGR